jgi:hypothetical protein
VPPYRFPTPLKAKLRAKTPEAQGAILKCIAQLSENPRIRGLRTSKIQGERGVWEARAGRSRRVSWEWEGGRIVILNHCDHDEVLKRPRG